MAVKLYFIPFQLSTVFAICSLQGERMSSQTRSLHLPTRHYGYLLLRSLSLYPLSVTNRGFAYNSYNNSCFIKYPVSGWRVLHTQKAGPPPLTWRSSLPKTEPWIEDKQTKPWRKGFLEIPELNKWKG